MFDLRTISVWWSVKFQFVGEFHLKEYATVVCRGFFFVFSRSVFGFRITISVNQNQRSENLSNASHLSGSASFNSNEPKEA